MKYYATYYVNGWSSVAPYVGHNKKQLHKDIREICKGEWSRGKLGRFYVDDENGKTVYFGQILPNGVIQYVTKNYVDQF
jgi:hypothetical protein